MDLRVETCDERRNVMDLGVTWIAFQRWEIVNGYRETYSNLKEIRGWKMRFRKYPSFFWNGGVGKKISSYPPVCLVKIEFDIEKVALRLNRPWGHDSKLPDERNRHLSLKLHRGDDLPKSIEETITLSPIALFWLVVEIGNDPLRWPNWATFSLEWICEF